uniref:Transposase (Putative), gypsy type n=1 Tax=Tanacetum cinerariifolium TaxID=118510 RepID=A0A6L2MSI4_TANCI|nr:hypothetical protein [Tanacetum cinerariifolium]
MSSIDDIKSILTQSGLDALCDKFHIPPHVHPELPGRNIRIHNSPTSKIGVYTRDGFVCLYQSCASTKVRIKQREVAEGEDEDVHAVNEESGDDAVVDQTEQSDQVVYIGGIDIVADDEAQAIVVDKPKKSLLEGSTLPVEVGVMVVATLPFITSSVSLTPERERDDEVTYVIRAGTEPIPRSIFRDSASTSEASQDIAGPSHPVGTELFADSFFVLQDAESETFRQTYIPKWNVTNNSALDHLDVFRAARQTFLSTMVRLRLEHELRGRRKFEDKCAMQAGWLKDIDVDITNLKARLSLKEAEAAKAICLRGQIATVEAAKATRASELEGLKKQNAALEGQATALESAAVTKDYELASSNTHIAKLTQDLSNLQLSCDELSIKASSLEFEKDKLVYQVSKLEDTCSELRDEVSGYKLFKEQIEVVRDVHVKVLSDRVTELDANLMRMALHLDEEFYPCFLTTIVGRRWIFSRGIRLVVMKCLQSPKYLAALGGAIGCAIDKGIQGGLAAGIDHGKVGMDLTDVAAYDLLRRLIISPLIADIMGLLHLEGLAAEAPEAGQLKPSPEQLMLPFTVCRTKWSSERLPFGEANTSGVPVTAATTALSTTFIQASIVLSISVVDHDASGAWLSTKVPPPYKIVFEKEVLETTPEHTAAS